MKHHTIRIVIEGDKLSLADIDRLVKEINKQVKHFEVESVKHANWMDRFINWWTT